MRRLQTVGLLLCGIAGSLAASACSDEKSGPGISDDTVWRVACARRGGACNLDYESHGGAETAGEIKVECRKDESGLSITLEDPGTASGSMKGRDRSILEINFINTDKNRCTVGVTEYVGGSRLVFTNKCEGNDDGTGLCTITGEMNSEGYDFNGSIYCEGLVLNRASAPDFKLEDGENQDQPVPLKIVNCR